MVTNRIIPWQEKLSDREIAAMFAGFAGGVGAIQMGEKFPNIDEIKKHALTAIQILDGGAFNPLHVYAFKQFMQDNFQ